MKKKNKNIGMVLDSNYPPDPRVENEAKYLIKNGFNVFILCFDFFNQGLPETEKLDGVHIHRVSANRFQARLSALAYTFPFYQIFIRRHVRKFISTYPIDHLHIHDIAAAKGALMANFKNLPTILDLHENRPEIMKHYEQVKNFPGKFLIFPSKWKKAEARLIHQVKQVIVVTKEAKEYYRSALTIEKDKIKVVPNTVVKSFYTKPKLDSQIIKSYSTHFSLLYLGNTGNRRGLKTILHAMPKLKEHIPKIKLIVVGTSQDQRQLEVLRKSLSLEEVVDLEGWKDVQLFPSYIKASKIGLSPLHKNMHHDTTFANKVFQYMSLGLPVIVSNCLAQENLVKDYNCGLVFKEKNTDHFIEKVIELYRDEQKYSLYSNNAKRAIEEHLFWENQASDLLKIYSEIGI